MVRPIKEIDWVVVDELLEAECTGVEIAARFDMHPETFYEKVREKTKMGFTAYAAQKKANGDSILRKVQYDTAVEDRDRTMQIWLGKQRLGQKEPKDTKDIDSDFVKNFMLALAQGRLFEFCTQRDDKKIVHDTEDNERRN
jgi:hypothetical protein